MERIRFRELRKRISWGSIIGGVVTVLAISILLSILATSIGLFKLDPLSDSPASGIGTTVTIWTVISLILSLAAGGFVAGKLAGADGIIHGFLVWATTLIITVILGAFLAVGAVRLTVNVLGSVADVAGSVLSGVGSAVKGVGSVAADQVSNLFDGIDMDEIDRTEVRSDIRTALRRSGVKEFQPEYLENQMKAVRGDLRRSVRKLATNPNDADKVINNFLERLQNRTQKAFKDVDRNDLTRAIANNTSLSRAEVDRAVEEYITLYNNTVEQGREVVSNLEQNVREAQEEWENLKQQARVEADKATNSAARSALWSFIALLIGGGLCAFAGFWGMRTTLEGYEA